MKKKLEKLACPGIEKFRISELSPSQYNPRVISKEALAGLTNSISRFGCVEPIVVNIRGKKNTIIGGHQRYRALKRLKIKECICVTVNCSKGDEKLLNLTLNNPHIQGQFIEGIAAYIDELRAGLTDQAAYLDLRIAQLRGEIEEEKTGLVPDDDVPRPPKKAVTKMGDLWILGKHRLLCGDSTKEKDVKRLMGSHKASLLATDPPYYVDYTGMNRPKSGGKDWSEIYKDQSNISYATLLRKFYLIGKRYVRPRTAYYLWHADKKRAIVDKVAEELGMLVHQQIIWVKPSFVFGYSFYPWRHEPCVLLWKKKYKPGIAKRERKLTSTFTTVWYVGFQKEGDPTTPEYYTDVWELDYDGKKRPAGIEHPTVKPVEVFAIPMRVHTKTGDICYEPFCGSGTQIIAAEKLGRRCFAIEKEPVFVDVAVKRWEQWTGKKAKLISKSRRGRKLSK